MGPPTATKPPGYSTRLAFSLRVWARARALPFLVRRKPLEEVVAIAEAPLDTRLEGLPLEYIVRRCRKSVKNPILMRDRRCLREALLGFYFLRRCGYLPQMLFGIDQGSINTDRISAHCWVSVDGRPVISDALENMVTIYTYPSSEQSVR